MLVLATDTSTPYLSIALLDQSRVLAEINLFADRKHSEKLLLYTDKLLQEAAVQLSDIDLLAVTHGPGSFTGVRVGVSAWKGLALGAKIPLLGISTLGALARRVEGATRPVCVLLDAKMKEVYAATYQQRDGRLQIVNTETVAPISAVLENAADDTLFLGDGATLNTDTIRAAFPNAQLLPSSYDFPGAVATGLEAITLLESGIRPEDINVTPVYLRKSQAEIVRDEKLAEVKFS